MNSPNPTPDLKQTQELIEHGRVTMSFDVEFPGEDPSQVYLSLSHQRSGENPAKERPGEVLAMWFLMQALTGSVDGEGWVWCTSYAQKCGMDQVPEEIPTTGGASPHFPEVIVLSRDGKTREAWLNEKVEAILTAARLKVQLLEQDVALNRYRDRVRALYRTMKEPTRSRGAPAT